MGKARGAAGSMSGNRLAIRELSLLTLILGVLSGICGHRIAQVAGEDLVRDTRLPYGNDCDVTDNGVGR